MNRISNIIGSTPVSQINGKRLEIAVQKPLEVEDVFASGDKVKNTAKRFSKDVILPLSDKRSEIYRDYLNGGSTLNDSIDLYTEVVESFSPDEADRFEKLVFGYKQYRLVDEESATNTHLNLFRRTLNKKLSLRNR